MRVRVHVVTTRVDVLDKAEAKRPSAVLIALKLGNSSFGCVGIVKADDSATTRSTARLVLDLGLLDLANRGEELDEIFIASGPRELQRCQ